MWRPLSSYSLAQLPVTAQEFVSLQVAVNPGPAALAAQGVLQVLLIEVPMQLVMPAVLLVVLGQATLFVAAGGRFVHVLTAGVMAGAARWQRQ